jgi:uncharacterized cysteine cluster protein YcgN (CxxCxxCC family)
MSEKLPFWKTKPLEEMSLSEWESLCDGCGLCCLNKLEDEESGEVVFTRAACKYLDIGTCRCTDYANRQHNVPDCVGLTSGRLHRLHWLPETCGYRVVAEGRDLPWWHLLVSGDPQAVHRAGISVRGRVVPEQPGQDLEEFIIRWVRPGGRIRRALVRRYDED